MLFYSFIVSSRMQIQKIYFFVHFVTFEQSICKPNVALFSFSRSNYYLAVEQKCFRVNEGGRRGAQCPSSRTAPYIMRLHYNDFLFYGIINEQYHRSWLSVSWNCMFVRSLAVHNLCFSAHPINQKYEYVFFFVLALYVRLTIPVALFAYYSLLITTQVK